MFDVLDFSDTVSSCPQRQVTTVAPQALSLFNGDFVMQQSRHLAARLEKEAGADLRTEIQLAWRLALRHRRARTTSKRQRRFALLNRIESLPKQSSFISECLLMRLGFGDRAGLQSHSELE